MNSMSGTKVLLRKLSIGLFLGLVCSSQRAYSINPSQNTPGSSSKSSESTATAAHTPQGVPFAPEKLTSLLPATVYFQERTAPLQIRNAAGTSFGDQAITWAALVDSSGYSSSVQERYQFYLVTESGLRFGDVHLPAGAYGGGYVGDHFVLMDLGGHTFGEGRTQMDTTLRRPRPLQMIADRPNAVKLYLGRRWVLLQADPAQTAGK